MFDTLSQNWLEKIIAIAGGDMDPSATLQELKDLFETDVFPHFD
jgi:hypothetical protein